MRTLFVKVAGVTFEGRQEYLKQVRFHDPCQLRPETDNQYDKHAIAVYVAVYGGAVLKCGYVPRDVAQQIAPLLEDEEITGRVFETTGGFAKWDGSTASLGLIVEVIVPGDEHYA